MCVCARVGPHTPVNTASYYCQLLLPVTTANYYWSQASYDLLILFSHEGFERANGLELFRAVPALPAHGHVFLLRANIYCAVPVANDAVVLELGGDDGFGLAELAWRPHLLHGVCQLHESLGPGEQHASVVRAQPVAEHVHRHGQFSQLVDVRRR